MKQRIKRDFVVRALRNPALSSLMSLDPYFPDYAQRHLPGGGKVVPIDDPAPTMPALVPELVETKERSAPPSCCLARSPNAREHCNYSKPSIRRR